MEENWNPLAKSLAAGAAAAVVAIIAGITAGEGLAVVEILTAILAFLAASGLTQAVSATNELKAVRREQMKLDSSQKSLTKDYDSFRIAQQRDINRNNPNL